MNESLSVCIDSKSTKSFGIATHFQRCLNSIGVKPESLMLHDLALNRRRWWWRPTCLGLPETTGMATTCLFRHSDTADLCS